MVWQLCKLTWTQSTKKSPQKKEKEILRRRRRREEEGRRSVQGEQCNLSNNFPQHLILCNFSLLSTNHQQHQQSKKLKEELQAQENVREEKLNEREKKNVRPRSFMVEIVLRQRDSTRLDRWAPVFFEKAVNQ